VIAAVADRVLVLYGGTVVENAPVDELFADPQHPYTRALLAAVPSADTAAERPAPIPGTPPIVTEELESCPFAERCRYVFDRCRYQRPGLAEVGPDHHVACFWDVESDCLRDDVPVAASRKYVQ
jgi:peptide/nickel transport system ATP-binding protein/oligopeptide transport system ATP-binding protein